MESAGEHHELGEGADHLRVAERPGRGRRAPGSCTDEAWSRRVGNVTPQHAGRLRRVYQRFAAAREQFEGLYWSHFQAALDWDDAEMWLEGAVQNGWSIAQMHDQRAAVLGRLGPQQDFEARATDEVDEDAPADPASCPETISGSLAEVHGNRVEDGRDGPSEDNPQDDSAPFDAADAVADAAPPVRPFENLPPLPADLAEAFEAFKLAIIHHRLAAWQEISCEDVLVALESLRQLVLAPAE